MQSETVEKCVQSAVLSVIAEHPMGHWRDDQVKEVARRAIAEAALSTDAEPVAIYKGNGLVDCGESGHHNIELLKLIPANTPLYAEPVKTAPALAVKPAMTDAEINQWIEACNHEPAKETLRHYLTLRSAQVQDVAGWQAGINEAISVADNEAEMWGHEDGSSARVVAARLRTLLSASPASKHGDAE